MNLLKNTLLNLIFFIYPRIKNYLRLLSKTSIWDINALSISLQKVTLQCLIKVSLFFDTRSYKRFS